MQDDVKERAVNFDATAVVDETKFPESIHEEADPRPRVRLFSWAARGNPLNRFSS